MVPRPVSPSARGPLLPQFYAGREVFITGATGFMGKVLVERLLSTCPDVGRLHLLLRAKRDVCPDKRLLQLRQSPVFDAVRARCPAQLDKLCAVPGDATLPDLGISLEHMMQLQGVSIVFHSAATLKFDEALGKAVNQNVRSVIRLMDICDRLPNIEAFVYVSTAYSNAERTLVEECVYPAPVPLDRLLALADAAPEHLMAQITDQYISPKPNTYTFTKAMAERAVIEHEKRTYPAAIFRPTIVISAHQHPFPGWVENLNGPSGIVVGAGKGLLHVFCCKEDARADLLPVDIAIDTLLAVAWETALDRCPEPRVYNCSMSDNPTTWRQFERSLRRQLRAHPLDDALWYPCGSSVQNRFAYKALEFFYQTIPLHLAEYGARLVGIKTRLSLITVSQRLSSMNAVLRFFSLREWHFVTDNVRRLRARLSPADKLIYNLDPTTIDWEQHQEQFVVGARRYLLRERDQDLPAARRHMRRMHLVHNGLVVFLVMLVLRAALHNPLVRHLVHTTLRLVLTIFSTAYTRISSAFLKQS